MNSLNAALGRHQGCAESCQGARREARPSRRGSSRSQVQGGGSPTCGAAQAGHCRVAGQGAVSGEDRRRVEQAEGGNASRWPVGSFVGAESAATSRSLMRLLAPLFTPAKPSDYAEAGWGAHDKELGTGEHFSVIRHHGCDQKVNYLTDHERMAKSLSRPCLLVSHTMPS
jgi:hypothetical protein